MALTKREQIEKRRKVECDAAWDAMSKRYSRAFAKADRELVALQKQEMADAVAAGLVRVPTAKKRSGK